MHTIIANILYTDITMLQHKLFLAGRRDDHQDAVGPAGNTTYQVNIECLTVQYFKRQKI